MLQVNSSSSSSSLSVTLCKSASGSFQGFQADYLLVDHPLIAAGVFVRRPTHNNSPEEIVYANSNGAPKPPGVDDDEFVRWAVLLSAAKWTGCPPRPRRLTT